MCYILSTPQQTAEFIELLLRLRQKYLAQGLSGSVALCDFYLRQARSKERSNDRN